MNKTDKFLYGGFAVALVGFVAMMLVSVFSPLKQSAKETAQPLPPPMKTIMPDGSPMPPIPDGYAGYWVDDDGTLVYVTQEELDEGEEELKRKEAEEAERIAREKAEKEWWESRQEWIERFPFEPTYHPEVTFDPHDPSRRCALWWKTTVSCGGSTQANCATPKSSSSCTTSSKKSPEKKKQTIPSFSDGRSMHLKSIT